MRTVSFSSEPVRQILNQNFICTLINTTGDPSAGNSMGHAPSDSPGMCTRGVGKQNVQCLFMTPHGNLFHTASGYRSATDLLEEIKFALNTFQSMKKRPAFAAKIVRDTHMDRMRQQGFGDSEIAQPSSPFASISNMLISMQRHHGNSQSQPFNVFAAKTRDSDLADGRFSVHHPLMPIHEFLANPRILVGHERSAFSSVGNGSR